MRTIKQPVGFNGKEVQGYFMISNRDAATAILNKLTGSQVRLWLYLMMIDTYADLTKDGEAIFHPIPSPIEIGIKLGVATDTVQKDMRKLKKLGLYDYRITSWQGHNLTSDRARKESQKLKNKTPQTQSGKGKGLFSPPQGLISPPQGLFSPPQGLISPPENPKPLPDKASEPLQTIQNIQTSQTGGGSEILIEETGVINEETVLGVKTVEVERTVIEAEEEESPLTQLGDVLKRKIPPRVDEKVNNTNELINTEIPQDLVNKLEELEIPLDEKVRKAIASHHLSQAYGAAAHVENTWETIDNPRGVFLYQIKRQPIEKLGPTGRVYTASDHPDITLDQLKHLYPKTWQDAANHFGIEIPEGEVHIEAKDPEQEKKRKQEIIEKYKLIFPNDWQRLAKSMGVEYE